jgi:6-phosphogluconolactonase (cycloisomerase 2 family)
VAALAGVTGPTNRLRAQEATPVTSAGATPVAGGQFLYVGSYTRAAAEEGADPATLGISVFAVDPATGALTLVQTVESDNPSFVALDPSQRFLYAVNENADYEGEETGSVEAYAIDPATGELTLLNRQSSAGAIPAHLAVDPAGDHVVVGNYIGQNYVVLPINEDGSLAPVSGSHENTGSGPNADRQEAPHPHATTFDPGGNFVATADLGIDKVQIFDLIEEDGTLELVSEVSTAPGAGPRHVGFNPEGTILYVLNELDATIVAYAYDSATGMIGEEIQTVSTVPDPFEGTKSTAEIFVHPSGRFLYSSNRGQPDTTTPEGDAIVAWAVDPETGELTLLGHTTDDIEVPRNFAIDPTGTWLYVANQEGDSIVQFAIDQETGELTPTGNVVETSKPVALVFTTP